MSTETTNTPAAPKRPWYKVRRIAGLVLGGIGAVIILAPGAPVIATVAGIGITTTMVGVATTWLATNVFAYGQGAKSERAKSNEK